MTVHTTSLVRRHAILLVTAAQLSLTVPLAWLLCIWTDEAFALHTTGSGVVYAFNQAQRFELQPPFYFALLAVWRTVSPTLFWARGLSVLAVAAAIPVTAGITRRYFPRVSPVAVAVAFACSPFSVWAAVEARVYGLAMLMSGLLMLLFFDGYIAQPSGRRARYWYAVVAVLGVYTHYYLGFILAGHAVALLVVRRWRPLLEYVGAMVVVGVSFSPMLLAAAGQATVLQRNAGGDIGLLDGFRFLSWRIQDFVLSASWTTPLRPARDWLLRIGYVVTAVYLAVWRRANVGASHVTFWALVASLVVGFRCVLGVAGPELMQPRHTVALFIPAVLLTYSVLEPLRSRHVAFVWTIAVALFSGAALFMTYKPMAKAGDWKRTAAYVLKHEKPRQPVLVCFSEAALPFRYHYTGRNQVLAIPRELSFRTWHPRDSALVDENEIRRALATAGAQTSEAWLVTSGPPQYLGVDFHGEILEQLVRRCYTVVQARNFIGTQVRLLRPTGACGN